MKVTRSPIGTKIELRGGLVCIESEAWVPEAPGTAQWIKLSDVLDPGYVLAAKPNEPLRWDTLAEYLGLVTQRLIEEQAASIKRTWDYIDAHGFDAYQAEVAKQR